MAAGRAEAARAAFRLAQLRDLVEFRERDGGRNQLGDAVAAPNGKRVGAMIDHDDLELATIIAVDRAGRVGNGDAVLQCQARARPDLDFITFRDGNLEAGRDRMPLTGLQFSSSAATTSIPAAPLVA